MGHQIDYLEFSKKTSPKTILKKLNGFAYDPHESSGYHGNLTFHDSPVYPNMDEAHKAIERYDKGWYSDHAVVFKDEKKHLKWLVKYEYHC